MDLRAYISEILERGHLMSLATHDEGGVWVSDVIYVYKKDLTLYWMSDPEVRHSRALLATSHVAGTITVSNTSKEPNLGIQFHGRAQKIDGPVYELAKKHLLKRGYPEPFETDDVLQGDSWYLIKPISIDIIDETKWGYDKQTLNLGN